MKSNLERLRRHSARLFSDGPTILMYHHVGESAAGDPWCLAVSPQRFREQLSVIRRHRQPMGLAELVRRHASRELPRNAVAITFDDGYASNLRIAKPALEEFAIPATVFVTSGFIDAEREPWWDQLADMLLGPTALPEVLQLKCGGHALAFQQRHWPRRQRMKAHREIHRLLVRQPEPEQQRMLDLLRGQIADQPAVADARRTMSTQELRTLGDGGLLEIGAHTVTHPSLTCLSPQQQYQEISCSKRELEAVLDRTVDGFAFPYGDHDEASLDALSECGFRYACTSTRGFVHARDNALRLPRLMVKDWDGEEFAKRFAPANRVTRLLPRWRFLSRGRPPAADLPPTAGR